MRRAALLLAGGALWLFLAAFPVLADGGPHQLAVNNGTSGLSGDCAACHRAHTAQAADLLKQELPALCLACHDGTGATTDVVDGNQFVPDGSGNPTGTVLGALRGGGFSFALIDSSNASRVSIGGTWLVTFSGAPTGGTFQLTFNGTATADIPYSGTDAVWSGTTLVSPAPVAVSIESALVAIAGTDSTYTPTLSASQRPKNANNVATSDNVTVAQAKDSTGAVIHDQFVITAQFALRLNKPTIAAGTSALTGGSSPSVGVSDTTQSAVRQMAAVPALAATAKVATSSSHEGAGTVWGNGAQGIGTDGATGVVLDCAKCHNPHGNGQYRILNTTPGEDWVNGSNGVAGWTAATSDVEVAEATPATLTAGQVRNYTVKAGNLTTDVSALGTGDYWRYKYDPSGTANWTDFYLSADQMNTGWDGAKPTNKAANGNVAPANTTGLLTAWCITCHTRYNGYSVDTTTGALKTTSPNGPSSLNLQTPSDSVFMFKHGTTRIGCEQCHVSHGSNAAMTAQFSAAVKFPDGTAEDSALLKLNNRGTCNMCHDPTGTVTPGTVAGNAGKVPGTITAKY